MAIYNSSPIHGVQWPWDISKHVSAWVLVCPVYGIPKGQPIRVNLGLSNADQINIIY